MNRVIRVLGVLAALFFLSAGAHAEGSGQCPNQRPDATVKTLTSYTIGTGDQCKLIVANNSGAIAYSLPAPGTAGGFYPPFTVSVYDEGAGAVTITPTAPAVGGGAAPTINGASTLVISQGQSAAIVVGTDGKYYATGSAISGLTLPLAVANGGTGATTLTASGLLQGNGTEAVTASLTPAGVTSINGNTIPTNTSGTLLTTAGAVSGTTGLTVTPLEMVNMKTVAGLQMTGSASSTNYGLVYTPGTGAYLIGTATSSGSTSNVAAFDLVLPPNYIAGTNITLSVACYYTNSSSTASVHTMAAAAYLNNVTLGTQGSTLIATSAQTCPITTAAAQTFTITGTSLVPGSYLTLTFSAAVTNAAGASTEFLTGVTYD